MAWTFICARLAKLKGDRLVKNRLKLVVKDIRILVLSVIRSLSWVREEIPRWSSLDFPKKEKSTFLSHLDSHPAVEEGLQGTQGKNI